MMMTNTWEDTWEGTLKQQQQRAIASTEAKTAKIINFGKLQMLIYGLP